MATYRIGIDVGGTFTHAVALDAASFALAAQAKVPTTHRAARGVAEGVVDALRVLLRESGIAPSDITFLAYSTTQITNALLEGDVATVGIIALGAGMEGKRAQAETRLGDIELAPGRQLKTLHTYLDAAGLNDASASAAVSELAAAGAAVIVAAEAFSVDDPSREQVVMAAAQQAGLPATGTHEISGRYGLRIRTRTAVINASLLPKTISTANLVETAVREAGITAPLMVVRSDGGVISIEDMRRRPLLTLLSGPAAGVAAALMYVRVSDGVFLEVGGTSTDITAIQHGTALLRTAEVGGHRLFLRTLDVRTIGVAGGSMPRVRGSAIIDAGPRSAHLAGLHYSCFSTPDELRQNGVPKAIALSPIEGDPADYVAIETASGGRVGVTLTCAANAAGRIPEGDWAHGDPDSARIGLTALGQLLAKTAAEAAQLFLDVAAEKAARTVEALVADRRMNRETTGLIAGGGGASALVPAVGQRLDMPVRLAPNAPVVSAIGTALAVVRDVVERTVPEASEADVLQIRREAAEAAARAGADPESITVDVEYDSSTAVLRAVATGQTELRARDLSQGAASDEERTAAAANAMRLETNSVRAVADSVSLRAYQGERERKRLLGLGRKVERPLALVDRQGVVRLTLPGGVAAAGAAAGARELIAAQLDEHTRYGDAGAELPQLFLGVRGRIVNLSGLLNAAQVIALAQAEIAAFAADEQVMIAIAPRGT